MKITQKVKKGVGALVKGARGGMYRLSAAGKKIYGGKKSSKADPKKAASTNTKRLPSAAEFKKVSKHYNAADIKLLQKHWGSMSDSDRKSFHKAINR